MGKSLKKKKKNAFLFVLIANYSSSPKYKKSLRLNYSEYLLKNHGVYLLEWRYKYNMH